MLERIELIRMAREAALHAAHRQAVVAGNVANADTPGYRAIDARPFAEVYGGANDGVALRATRPGHVAGLDRHPSHPIVTDDRNEPSPNGNTVSLETELVKGAAAKRQHDVSLAVYRSTLDILRSAIGRGR